MFTSLVYNSLKEIISLKKRSQIKDKYKWNFKDYFSSINEWEEEYKNYEKELETVKKYDGKLSNKKEILDCLKLLENISLKVDALYVYANCNSDVDVTNTIYQALLNKIETKLAEHSSLCSFIQPQLLKLDEEFLKNLILDKDFKGYTRILKDVLREKKHTLSQESENLLSLVSSFSGNFSQNHSNFENGDLKFRDIKDKNDKSLKMSNAQASIYLRSSDEVLRENAYKELHGAYGRYNNFLTSNYLGSVKKDIFFARARNFSSALESALFYEEIKPFVYENLIKNVENHLDLNQKYFSLKKKFLKLKTFKLSDIYYNPIKINNKYSYEEGFELVCKALSVLGDDYISYLNKMKNEQMIDVFPNENKRSGAYQTMATKRTPLVLTNFMGTFNDISTLAHELGHAMHSVYSDNAQSPFDASYTIFLAEIASTVNEILLNDYFTNNAKSKNEKIFYVNELLFEFYSTIFRQTMFADFESKIHKKAELNEELSSNVLNETYLELVKKYFGRKVKIFKEVRFEWSKIPHFYTAFYVYKYATGIISAINIVENLKNGIITINDYKKFLSSGCTDTPTELLKIVKVDYDTEKPFEVAFNFIKNKLKEFEKFIDNIK